MTKLNKISTLALVVSMLGGCTSMKTPDNIEPVSRGDGYQAQYREPGKQSRKQEFLQSAQMNAKNCLPLRGGSSGKAISHIQGERVTRNDLIEVLVNGDDTLSGNYVVSRDGTLKLPFLNDIRAEGRLTSQIEDDIAAMLLADDFFVSPPRVSVRISDFASVNVGVWGAVFEPHAVEIGMVSNETRDDRRQDALGSSTEARNLSAALRAAGGVRPDADISAVELYRGDQKYILDMRGVFEGNNLVDVMLLSGDEVRVPSRQCFQEDLMRPSPISPPGINLFISNLTQPATGNAPSANGHQTRQVPYGTRYLQATVNMNCVGGIKATNANRSAVLFSRNPLTGVSVVIERNIERMMRSAVRDDYDPYLLPGDAMACYDSTVTNIADVGRVVTTAAVPGL